jgi:hypothetical protein
LEYYFGKVRVLKLHGPGVMFWGSIFFFKKKYIYSFVRKGYRTSKWKAIIILRLEKPILEYYFEEA